MSCFILSNDENIVKSLRLKDVPADYDGPIISVSDGNKKLKSTKGGTNEYGEYIPSTAWLIFNINAVTTCPFRTKMCGGYERGERRYNDDGTIKTGVCYAARPEWYYPTVLPARRKNLLASLSDNFVPMMTAIILRRAKSVKKERLIVRIHEAGDFYSREYMLKWLEIARNCADCVKVVFWAYTKSFEYFDGVELPSNFKLRASIFPDTKGSQLEIIRRNKWPVYHVVPSLDKKHAFYGGVIRECRCKDCADCNQCGDMSIADIACKEH